MKPEQQNPLKGYVPDRYLSKNGGVDLLALAKDYAPIRSRPFIFITGTNQIFDWENTVDFQKLPDTDEVKRLRSDIIQHFSPHWELNDRGHRAEHFEEVFQCARYLNDKLGLGYADIDMMFAGYFHDLFAWSRINHHELAQRYFLTTDHPLILRYYEYLPFDRETVANACLEHRASFRGEFSSSFSELINSADRGFPGDAQRLFTRVMKHHTDINPGKSVDEITAISLEFIKRKAGSNGYCRYPDIYLSVFGEELKKQQADIDNLGK